MIASHIHDALAQVRVLQQKILEKQRFKGYSGRARAVAGTFALFAAAIISSDIYPQTVAFHLYGWGGVLLAGFVLNYGALIHWFLFNPTSQRDIRRLRPALDALPFFFIGGSLTLALLRVEQVDLLFGSWMALFGLTCLATRQTLPRVYGVVGLFYVVCGAYFLIVSRVSILNPWPMGLVFFIGEWLGGIIFHYDDKLNGSLRLFIRDLFKTKGDGYGR
ncbi:MAG: hypothetical protein ACE5G1_05535 [bacterium]